MCRFIRKSKVLFFLVISLLTVLQYGCDKDEEVVPYVHVNFTIYLDDADFSSLNAVGNSVIVSGGYNGIIIYRMSFTDFVALERTCTYQPNKKCELDTDASNIFTTCECCESTYLLIDGSPMDDTKPAIMALKQYQTKYYEGSNTLYIYN